MKMQKVSTLRYKRATEIYPVDTNWKYKHNIIILISYSVIISSITLK